MYKLNMEKVNIVEEKTNHTTSSIGTPVFKSVASLVKIDSISIDIGEAMDKKVTEKCHHFSLRGYVADMRNKNVRICAPFACDGDDETMLREQLMPLHVPKFRWWCCQSCVQDISPASTSDSQQHREKASPSFVRGEIHPSPCSNMEKDDALMGLTVVCGQENGVKDVSNQKMGDQTLSLATCPPCPISEKHTVGRASEESTGRDLADVCIPEPPSDVATGDVLGSSGETCLAEKADTVNVEPMTVVIANETSNKTMEIDESTSVKDAGAMKKPSVELQVSDSGLNQCIQALNRDCHITKQHENTASFTRRKKKVRMLAELLNENGEVRTDRLASNNAMPNELAAPASTSSQRKRKITQEPSRGMQLPNSEAKKVRASKGDAKTTIATIHNSDSESEEDDTSAGTGLKNHMPLQQTGKGPCSSKLKTKMSHGEDRQGSYKSVPRGSFNENIGLDLSLNCYMDVDRINIDSWRKEGSCIGQSSAPDLSFSKDIEEDISGKIAYSSKIMRQQENSLSLHKKLDLSLGCSNKKATEAERFSGVSRKNSDQRSETVFEQRSYDDIPMEIVELMAKHQYERGLSEAERNSCLAKRIDERNYEMMGFSDVHGKGVRPLQKEHNKWNPVELSHASNNHFVVGNSDESHVLPALGICPQKVKELFGAQTPASRTLINNDTQNCMWSGDKLVHRSSPTDTQVFDIYNTAHNGPQHSGMARNIWASGASSLVPPKPSFPQNIASWSSNMATYLPSPDLHKGKTVRDLDLNRADPNDSDLGVWLENPFVANNTGRDLNQKEMESLHSFSNEAIPALQLLSLMDAGMHSRTPFSVDGKKVLEKPFFPRNNHPNLGMDERANLFEKPLFPQNQQVKEYSGAGTSTYRSSASTRHVSSSYYGPDIVTSQLPEKKKTYLPQQNKDWRARIPAGTSGVPDMIRDCNPHQGKQKGILGASADVVFPLQRAAQKITENHKDVGSCHMHGTIRPLRDISKEEVCSVNRNPADFTIPEAGNMYMIRGGDLKFSKDFSRTRIGGFDGQRRHG